MCSKQLRRLILVHRHGDRCPGVLGSNDPQESASWMNKLHSDNTDAAMLSQFPINSSHASPKHNTPPIGRLTKRGAQQLTSLGENIRSRYPTVTSRPTVWSSNYKRTQQSAGWLLLGLQAAPGTAITVQEPNFNSIDPFSRYKRISEITTELAQSEAFLAHEKAKGLDIVQEKLITMPCFQTLPFQWFHAVDVLTCHRYHLDVHKPTSIAKLIPSTLAAEQYMVWRFLEYYNNDQVLKLCCGDILSELCELVQLTSLETGVEDGDEIPLTVYSGHDVTVFPLAKVFGHEWQAWPEYASHLVLEVWQDEIKVLLNDAAPGCTSGLTVIGSYSHEEFKQIYTNVEAGTMNVLL
jgi:hypothetical protein